MFSARAVPEPVSIVVVPMPHNHGQVQPFLDDLRDAMSARRALRRGPRPAPNAVQSPSTASEVRISVDIGGTFTDLVLEDDAGRLELAKSPDRARRPGPGDPRRARRCAAARGRPPPADLLGSHRHVRARHDPRAQRRPHRRHGQDRLPHHRRATPTCCCCGRAAGEDPFDFTVPYPEPYVPRSLTFEVPGRLTRVRRGAASPSTGPAVEAIADRLRAAEVEAVGVCLLWSTVNPAHELAVGDVLAERLPEVPAHALARPQPVARASTGGPPRPASTPRSSR